MRFYISLKHVSAFSNNWIFPWEFRGTRESCDPTFASLRQLINFAGERAYRPANYIARPCFVVPRTWKDYQISRNPLIRVHLMICHLNQIPG